MRSEPGPRSVLGERDQSALALDRIVCGIDSSPSGLEALRQASKLSPPNGHLLGVSVWDPAWASNAGFQTWQMADRLRNESADALQEARREVPGLETRRVRGGQVPALLGALWRERADLVAVGSHEHSRLSGMVFASVPTAMVHAAPCSVLVARPPDRGAFPGLIVHATDGSPGSRSAAIVAGSIAARHDSNVIMLHVNGDPKRAGAIAEEAVALSAPTGRDLEVRTEHGSAARRIAEVAAESDASLLVVGSRRLTGIRALRSVSERVAHRARCSVLIVREPRYPSN